MKAKQNPDYKVKIEQIFLQFSNIQLEPAIINRHEQNLLRRAYAIYTYKRKVINKMYLPLNEKTWKTR